MCASQQPNLSSAMEDYLEAVLALKQECGTARISKIAQKLQVKSSSVNSAMKNLVELQLVMHEHYGYVELTEKGLLLATEIRQKHDLLFHFLTETLGVQPADAEQEACAIEHAISKKTLLRLTHFLDGLKS